MTDATCFTLAFKPSERITLLRALWAQYHLLGRKVESRGGDNYAKGLAKERDDTRNLINTLNHLSRLPK